MKHWRKGLKRITAVALAVMMIGTTVDTSALAVLAAEEVAEVTCNHVCDETCGGMQAATEGALNGCTHVHDEECGYEEAEAECTCGTDDPAFHATNCPAYIAPENPECICAEKCAEETLNVWCDVCGVQGVSACQGEDTAAVAKAVGIKNTPEITSSGGVEMYYMHGYDTYIVDGTNPNTTAVYYFENNDANSGNWIYVNPNGAAGDDLSASWIWSNGSTYELSGDMNIEMTGGSVNSIATGFNIYGSGNDKTNVNINISGGSCGSVRKLTDEYSEKVWLFSEQKVPELQNLTGYVTKTDSGWVAHGDAIIPEGKTVTVGEGEVFQIESGATLTNNGTIVNNGTINTYALLNGTVTGNGTVVRDAICINGTASSITVYKDGEEYPAQTEVVDGKTYIYVPAGEIKVDMDGEVYYAKYSAEAGEFEPESEPKGVTDFTNMPTEIKANEPFTLSAGMVDEWFNTTVTYEISVDDGTGAVLDGNVLTAYGAGTIQVTVTAMDTYDYTFSKTYEIVVAYTPVSDIEIDENISVPVGDSINLSRYAVTNADASYQTIEWSVVNANGTGATITDNLLTATAAGEATIRATVRNGNAYGEDYTEDFQVGFYAVEGISVNAGSITISKKDDNTITVTGGNVANGSKDYNKNEIIRIYGETTSNTITISEGTTVNLILTDVKIDVSGTEGAAPLYVNSNAQLNLTLEGTNELKGGFNAAALGVPSGAELVIEESSTGTLEATGGHDGAGIGGGRNGGIGISSGTITINGGTITAICNSGWATGIGGGNGGSGGTTTINGGTITAISSKRYGAGIGGGTYGSGGTVIINGGTVTAEGYYGIGNGEFASGGTLKITGGNISGTYNIAPTDGSNEVSCYTCKFIGDSEDMAGKTVTAITLENDGTYGLKDVVTFDGGSENEGYFNCYLPAGSKITSITVDGTTYICRGEDGTCYVDHYDWVDATCQKPEHCSVCELTRGDVIDHDWVDATCQKPEHCSVCELTRGDVIEHDYVGGFCTMCLGYNSDVVVIDSPEDLVAFANSVNAGNKSLGAVLDADIDMTGVAWTPICQTVSFHDAEATDTGYSGTFYGNGHTISNLTVTGISGGTYSYGLFGTVSGTVKNLGMVNYTYTMGSAADARAGSIAGQVLTGGTITNCYSVEHTVTTNSNIAGGIAGCNYGGTISNCYALNGSVSGYSSGDSIRWGGVVGDCKKDDVAPDQAQTYGTVSYCYTDDKQVASTQNNSANITNCALKEDAAFASGEIAYLLNCSLSENVAWYQTLETDTYPVLNSEHGTVYYGYTTELPCEVSYTNDKNSLLDQQGEHDWNEGVCTKCDVACTHSYVANGECLICGFVTELSVKLTDGGAFAEGEYTFADNIHTINTNKSVTISGTTTCERVFIAYGCDANIILAGVDINVSGIGYAYGIGIADNSTGDVTITLKEGTTNKISAGRRAAAVQKNVSNVASEEIGLLTIQGEGSLEANGGTDAAGIGGGYTHTSKITIAGGNITAKGQGAATGIGAGGFYKECSYITISGGTITAIGDNGIEYGIGYVISDGNSSNIFISGGSVNAIEGISIRPRVSAENSASVYLLEIDNPEGRDITINDKDYPDFHGDEKKIYAYLPAGTAGNPNIVKFSGNTVGAYYYDGGWKTVTCADGHTASEDDGDCTTDITCEKCGHVITEGADAHAWENGECTNCEVVCEHISNTDDGDCTTAVICTVCGKVITEAEAEHIDSNDDGWCDVCDSGVAPEFEDGYYQIANAGNLSWFAKFVSNGEQDANAVLLADIDMTGVAWTPICQTVSYNTTTATDTGYTGIFDGQGHTISKLTVTGISGGTYSYGLFGTVSGTVKNLGMVKYEYILGDASDARAGSIAGQVLTDGTIINCYSVGHTVTTNSKIAGGIAGCNYGGTISNCYALNGSVSGYSTRWGGVVGDCKKDNTAPDLAQTYGTVSNCYTDDERVASTQNNSANITNCAVKDDAAFASGEITYLLNGSSSGNVTWYQTLEADTYPVLDSEHDKVYSVFKCNGTTPAGYSNVNENEPHTDNNSDGVCDVCGGNAHIHEWTYTASNNTITAECGAADCPATGTNTIVLSASDKNYDGTAVVATVENNVDGTDYDSEIVYKDSTGAEVNAAIDAGTYTANLTVGGVTAKVEFTIAKVTPDIGTVSASNMENTLDVSEVVLSRSNETVPGTFSLAEGTTLQYGIHDYTYVFTPNDNTNYETVTETVSITISDTNAPTATYKVGTDEWKQFINTITFGHFCKDNATVDITYSDEESGVADKQYYITEEEITNTENIQWSEYTDTLNINATGKFYIYVRVTDNYGNVVIQNSEGIVVYAESVIAPTSFSCVYGEENSLDVDISTNGNTFENLTDGSGNEIDAENYSIDESTLTIKGEYLSDLDVGEYTYKICMNPQGVENTEATLAYSFVVKVTAKELTVIEATAASRAYIANDKTVDITGITLSGKQGTDDVSVEITGLKGTLSSANAGTYTSVTLPTLTLAGDDAKNYVLVQPTSAVATNVTINKATPPALTFPTATTITYGEKLSAVTLSDSSWAWLDGTIVPDSFTDCIAYIEVDDSNYNYTGVDGYDSANHRVVRKVDVSISKATLTITAKSYTIKVGKALPTYEYTVTGLVGDDTLPVDVSLSCSAANSNTAGTYTITIVGEVSDAPLAGHYAINYVNGTLTISEKDTQEITASDVTLTYGEAGKKLSAATNGGGAITYTVATGTDVISVAADGTITVLKAGTATVTIRAAETADYAAVAKTISVTVNKAENAPNMPSATMNVAYSVETVGVITLPEGWTWKEGDSTKALTEGGTVTVTAVYCGADAGNYNTEAVEVAIKRGTAPSVPGVTVTPTVAPTSTPSATPTVTPTPTKKPSSGGFGGGGNYIHYVGSTTPVPTVAPAPTEAPTAVPTTTPVPGTVNVPTSGKTVMDGNGNTVTSVVQEPGTTTKLVVKQEEGKEVPVTWESSNPAIAEVDKDGNVTMKKPGLAEVVATVGEGKDAKTETIVILVEEPRTYVNPLEEAFKDVRLGTSREDIPLIRHLKLGETVDINFYGVKNWKQDSYEYIWQTSDESVAVVDGKGRMTALKPGAVKLSLGLKNKADGHFLNVQSVEIVIPGDYENKILLGTSKNNTFDSIVLNLNERIDINFYGVKNWKKEDYEYYWNSSEPSVVWVDSLGRLVPVNSGKAEIFLVLIEKKNGVPRYVVPMEVTVPEK